MAGVKHYPRREVAYDADAVIEVKIEQVKRVCGAMMVGIAGLIMFQVLDPGRGNSNQWGGKVTAAP